MDRYAQTQMWGILKSWFWGKNKSLITIDVKSENIFSVLSDVNAFFHIHYEQRSDYFTGFSYRKASERIKEKTNYINHIESGQQTDSTHANVLLLDGIVIICA
jgi:hypothetical protein